MKISATGAKEEDIWHNKCPWRNWSHRKEAQKQNPMEVWKCFLIFWKFNVIFCFLNCENQLSATHENSLSLIDCLIRGLEVSKPGEVDENYSSLQVCQIEKLFLVIHEPWLLRFCTALWTVCVHVSFSFIFNLISFIKIFFWEWIFNSAMLIGKATFGL